MYKLMIVEDEVLAREAIMRMIDFTATGFEVVAVCEDGLQASEAYFQLYPDLVITDICMPYVSGLQLAGQIAEAGRGTRVIIITGYDDFNYARQAIKNQVSSYILKPVTPQEFRDVLSEARQALDEQAMRSAQIRQAQSQLRRSTPLARDQILNRLVQGSVDIPAVAGELLAFGLDPARPVFGAAVVQIDQLETKARQLNVNSQLLQYMVLNVISELAAPLAGFLAFSLTDGRSCVLAAGQDGQDLTLQMRSLGQQICSTVAQVPGVRLTLGLGQPVASLAALAESFRTAQHCLEYKILLPGQELIGPETVPQQGNRPDFSDLEDQIIRHVRLRDEDQLRERVDSLVDAYRLSYLTRADIQFEVSRLVSRLQTMLRTGENEPVGPVASQRAGATSGQAASARPEDASGGWLVLSDLDQIEDSQYLPSLCSWLTDLGQAAIARLRSRGQSESQRLTLRARQFIDLNFPDSQLSLMTVCTHLSVSLSYFSQFFKEETGQTFVEYLTAIRMEKARDLLVNSDRMLYDIAEQVGFENPAYFTVTFKKHVGIGPREYRKKFGRES